IKSLLPENLRHSVSFVENLIEVHDQDSFIHELNFFYHSEKNDDSGGYESNISDAVYGGGKNNNEKHYFFTSFYFNPSGKIGLGIFSKDSDFTEISICIVPFQKDFHEVLQKNLEELKTCISRYVHLDALEVLHEEELDAGGIQTLA
ncbi:MAG: hypothetical protein OEZ34_11425, partial [Spirochaetia bacterium]|nr:hypothetical protein [Spirochaetia bacterium]